MTKKHFIAALKSHGACKDGMNFVSGFRSAQAAWGGFVRSDWMFWWIQRSAAYGAVQGKIAREIALSVSHLWKATPAALEWLKTGNPALREQARKDAYADFAAAAFAAYADFAAAAAADFAAAAAGGGAAREKQLKTNCDIIRKYIPKCPNLEIRK